MLVSLGVRSSSPPRSSWLLITFVTEGGKYVIRLEEKYSVKITFPRDSDNYEDAKGGRREPLKSDEVLIKGGKKGVAGAKAEIIEVCPILGILNS